MKKVNLIRRIMNLMLQHKMLSGFVSTVLIILVGFFVKNNGYISQNVEQKASAKDSGIVNVIDNHNSGKQNLISNVTDFSGKVGTFNGVPAELYGEAERARGKLEKEKEDLYARNEELEARLYENEKERIGWFLKEFNGINFEQIRKYEELSSSYLTETAIRLFQPEQDREKISLQGKIFRESILGKISYEDAMKFSEMIKKVYWLDLKEFLGNKNIKIDDHNQSLVFSGIFEAYVNAPFARTRRGIGSHSIDYKLTSEGKKIYQIANEG